MIQLPREYIDEMIAHALAEAPNECGGVIAGIDGRAVKLYRVESSVKSAMVYMADPKANLRVQREIDDNDWTIMALYHSHTHSQAYPSPTDVEVARAWLDSCHFVIVSLQYGDMPVVRAFRIADGEIMEDEIDVAA
ncbi:MAG: M67 family metallopeptidase [Dehalococcoidia bacterium]|nr:M67 family metallopeptidase [Dehalococcoidia bacterium]